MPFSDGLRRIKCVAGGQSWRALHRNSSSKLKKQNSIPEPVVRDMLEQMRRSGQRPQMMDDDDEGLQAMLRRGINAQADDDQAAQVPVNLNEIPLGMNLTTFAQQENVRREIRWRRWGCFLSMHGAHGLQTDRSSRAFCEFFAYQ